MTRADTRVADWSPLLCTVSLTIRTMAMPLSVRRAATYEDLKEVPPHAVAEIVDGELYASPRPGAPHARTSSRLGGALDGPFDRGRGGPGGWIILDEPELHILGQVLVPDLAGWRRTRMPQMPHVAAFELAPDWICEVISPSTEALDRSLKVPRYAEAGVEFAWIIDPLGRSLEVYQRREVSFRLVAQHRDSALIRAVPFDAVEIELGALWER
jgi:Uma2 family endonuclease